MYEPEDDYMQEEHDSDEIITEMWQESAWITITAFFEEKGKIRFCLSRILFYDFLKKCFNLANQLIF